jgi:hypothetical protein
MALFLLLVLTHLHRLCFLHLSSSRTTSQRRIRWWAWQEPSACSRGSFHTASILRLAPTTRICNFVRKTRQRGRDNRPEDGDAEKKENKDMWA